MDEPNKAAEPIATFAGAVDRYRELFAQTKNPMYIWNAILCAGWQREQAAGYKPSSEPLIVPAWCADYLKEVAWDLDCLASGADLARDGVAGEDYPKLSSEAAAKLVPQALGLTRQGYSAFEQFQSTTELMWFFRRYEEIRADGKTSADAIELLMQEHGLEEERTVRRRIAAGRRHAEGDRPEEKSRADRT